MKLAKTGFGDLAIWVEEDETAPLAIVPKGREGVAYEAATRMDKLKADYDALIQKHDDAEESLKETIRVAAQKFIKERGWDECPYMEKDEPEGGCECPATQLLDEYSRWLFDGCSACPFGGCC